MAETIPSPLEGIEQISGRRPEFGMAKTFASSVPDHNLPVGNPGEKDSAGNLGVHRHLPRYFTRLVSVMYSKERKRFPEELFLPGFPTRDNLQTGTEDSQPPPHHPEPRPSRRRSHSSTKSLLPGSPGSDIVGYSPVSASYRIYHTQAKLQCETKSCTLHCMIWNIMLTQIKERLKWERLQ